MNPKHQVKRVLGKGRRIKYAVKERVGVARNYVYNVDSPRKKTIETRQLIVEGWIISKDDKPLKMRVRNNQTIIPIKTGIKRIDVAKSHQEFSKEKALYSGFSVEFEFEDGDIVVELSNGGRFRKLHSTTVRYGVELLPEALYNKKLTDNYPEHLNLIQNREKYYYEDKINAAYRRHEKDPRLMAIYLPQFHPFEENNKAWGQGFTEWSNVTTGQPRFIGHQQPILPKDLGFYDLRLESNIKEQIDLAKKYGIYGFCFYYYWFSGHKLMETPLNTFLSHKEWDFNFSICWANENWTKRWDGRDNDVIIAQEYREEDPLAFIKDVEHILSDKRYLTEDGKPILMVYRASELRDPAKYAEVWRKYFRDTYNKELQLVSFLSFDDQDPRDYGFDAALDFAPLSAFFKNKLFENGKFPYVDTSQKLLDINFSGVVADYRSLATNSKLSTAYDFPVYQCVTPSWDNDARKKGKGFVYQNSNPDLYAEWLSRLIKQEQVTRRDPVIFINAWNEWAEGAMMEPSMHLGHAVLNRTAEVLATYSADDTNKKALPVYSLMKAETTKLAVVVHLYYIDLWPEIQQQLKNITVPFDLFVSLNERDRGFEPTLDNPDTNIHTHVLPNRGRDVLPFLYFLRRIRSAGYEYVLKLHSKKSKHRKDGSSWFGDVLHNLLPSETVVTEIIRTLWRNDTGIIGPKNHLVSLSRHMGSNQEILKHLIKTSFGKQASKQVITNKEKYPYFGGTMFWARVDTLDPVLDLQLMPDDFQSEHGQVDGTTAHAVERLFGVVPKLNGQLMYQVSNLGLEPLEDKDYTEKYTYAP